MARRDKDFLGLEVVSLEDASVVGEVDGLIVDEAANRVVGLLLDMGIYEAKALAFSDVACIGEDAVMIESTAVVKPISEQSDLEQVVGRDVHVSDSLAISDRGDIVGTTGDFYVDSESGEIRGIELVAEEDTGEQTYVMPIGSVVRIGADLVMFNADFARRAVPSGEEL